MRAREGERVRVRRKKRGAWVGGFFFMSNAGTSHSFDTHYYYWAIVSGVSVKLEVHKKKKKKQTAFPGTS